MGGDVAPGEVADAAGGRRWRRKTASPATTTAMIAATSRYTQSGVPDVGEEEAGGVLPRWNVMEIVCGAPLTVTLPELGLDE